MSSAHTQPDRLGFWAASLSLIAVFAASATPIPLYAIYRAAENLTYFELSLTAVFYFISAITALLILGRLSNHVGRRPVVLLSVVLGMLACVVFMNVSGVVSLIIGRILQGLSCGLASSAAAAYVTDNAPLKPAWLAPAVTSTGTMVGLTIGAITSGALTEYAPLRTVIPYLPIFIGLAGCAVLLLLSRETSPRHAGALASLKPRFSMPTMSWKLFPVASCIFVATWALGGFFQAFGPSLAADKLGSTNALIAAIVFSSYMAPSVLGGPLTTRLSPAGAQRLGSIFFALCVGGLLASLMAEAVVPFLLASACAGIAQGAVLSGSIRGLLANAGPNERAGVFAVIFTTCYSGAAIPSLIAGQFARFASLPQVLSGYWILAIIACVVTLIAARNPVTSADTR
ncbi:Fucose permease [Kushneria avicenniae]|uniref:Fucose permease n=1 Tax=Kushneria avicenniae TaxID=402385 RepID=A0A1I1G341_9GAMM|nr:MFS transporter [Kushneria avicenniae]SFC05732.1 Fucose permease [Kushneria avicenniae]